VSALMTICSSVEFMFRSGSSGKDAWVSNVE